MNEQEEFEFRLRLEQEEEEAKKAEEDQSSNEPVNPLYYTLGGAFGAEVAGPAINKGTEAYRDAKAARLAMEAKNVPGTTVASTPSIKPQTTFNPKGVSVEQSLDNWKKYGEAQNEAAKTLRRDTALAKKYPNLTRAPSPAAQNLAAQKAEIVAAEAAKKATLGSKIAAKTPGVVKDLGAAGNAVMKSGVVPWLGRGIAGAGLGFEAADAYNRYQTGDTTGAIIGGLGALGSAASLIPHPATRIIGGGLGIGAAALNAYRDKQREKETEKMLTKATGGAIPGYSTAGIVKKGVQKGADSAKKLVGYLEHTPQKQNPVVGTRFEKVLTGNLVPKITLDLEKHRGAMIVPKPWDNTSRGETIKSVSGIQLQNPFETEGGRNWMLDKVHFDNDISGASGFEIANRIHGRVGTASRAGEKQGLSGQVLEMPITMGYQGADFSHHPTSVLIDLINQKEFRPDVLQQLSDQVRAYREPGKGQIYKNFVGYGDPRLEEQMFKGGFGLETTPGNLRKAMSHRGMLKENQKLIGFNEEDLRNALTDETLLGVPKGFGGGMFSEGRPYGALTPSQSRIYNTNNPGRYIGSSQEAPIEIWMPQPFGKIKDELSAKYPKKTGNSLRQDIIGALEKRKEGFYQPVNDQVINNIGYYQEGLKEGRFGPNDVEEAIRYVYSKKEGGSTTPAWQRKEGKNAEGGLNAAGRASYNRETGGNLKAPQPEGGPRKDSFCARMEGMKKKLTSAKTANDPDSRINKSLRKWKC